jgi:hypothetical protein
VYFRISTYLISYTFVNKHPCWLGGAPLASRIRNAPFVRRPLLLIQALEMELRSEMPCVEEHRQLEPLVL